MRKKFKHLNIFERQTIEIHIKKLEKQSSIAKILKRDPGTISREIDNNSVKKISSNKKEYLAEEAHIKAYLKRYHSKSQSKKINLNTELKKFIIIQLRRKDILNSPKIITNLRNKKCGKNNKDKHISHTSIYSWLETGMGNKYKKYLRCGFKGYRKKKTNYSKSRILNRIGIEIRDSISNINNEKGHFEADLIVSKKGFKSVLLTLIDRKTRFPRIYKLKDKTSENIMKKIVKIKKTLGIKSVTFDNGMEFAKHYYLNKRGINTYFSDPYSPWQKGQIENLNRRVRIFYPKGTNFDEVKKSEIKSVVKILTHTPREILSFNTPYQEHFQ